MAEGLISPRGGWLGGGGGGGTDDKGVTSPLSISASSYGLDFALGGGSISPSVLSFTPPVGGTPRGFVGAQTLKEKMMAPLPTGKSLGGGKARGAGSAKAGDRGGEREKERERLTGRRRDV